MRRARSARAPPRPGVQGHRWPGEWVIERVTTLNLQVVQADAERDLLLIKGAVPGPRGGLVLIRRRGEGGADRNDAGRRAHDRGGGRPRERPSSTTPSFGIEPNVAVMHQVVTAQLAAAPRRHPQHEDPGRGARAAARSRGGRRAPGGPARARAGRPHWAGGGVAAGPKPRSYRQKTPKKMVQLALRSALSRPGGRGRVACRRRVGVRQSRRPDAWRVEALDRLEGKARCSSSWAPTTRRRSSRSATWPRSSSLLVGELNAYDVLCNDWVVFTRATLPSVIVAGSRHEGPARRHPPPDREREVLRAARRGRLHVRGRTRRQQDRDPLRRSSRSSTSGS